MLRVGEFERAKAQFRERCILAALREQPKCLHFIAARERVLLAAYV